MLKNAYFLAKIGFDPAENEPAKKYAKIGNRLLIRTYHPHPQRPGGRIPLAAGPGARGRGGVRVLGGGRHRDAPRGRPREERSGDRGCPLSVYVFHLRSSPDYYYQYLIFWVSAVFQSQCLEIFG